MIFDRMYRCFFLLLAAAAVGLLWPVTAAQAQDDPEVSPRDTTALPNIAPQEVEIRGQLETRFPRLERQPLVGFNPPPRVPIISSDRRPLIGEYRQDTADLPGSPLRQPALAARSFHTGTPASGTVEALSGRYFDRQARVRVSAPLSSTTRLQTRLRYRGSEGHTPGDISPDASSARDNLEASLGLRTRGSRLSAEVDGGVFLTGYDMFGAVSSPEARTPTRDARGGQLSGRLETAGSRIDARLHVGGSILELNSDAVGSGAQALLASSLNEQRLHADGRATVPFGTFSVTASGLFDGSNIDETGGMIRDGWVQRYEGGGLIGFQPVSSVDVRAGARVIGYSDQVFSARGSSGLYVAPAFDANWYPRQGLQIYAYNEPATSRHDVRHLLDTSPFMAQQSTLRPTIRLWDTEAGVRTFIGPAQLGVHAGFEQNPTRRFFESDRRGDATLIRISHAEARIFSGGATLSVSLPRGLQTSLDYTYKDGTLTEQDTRIPYLAAHTASLSFTLPFAERRGMVELEGLVESDRVATRNASTTLDPFVQLNVAGSYGVTDALSVVGRMDNILGGTLERWENYPEAPQILSLGLRLRW